MPWQVLATLPNIDLREVIATQRTAIVPWEDGRVAELRLAHPNLDTFLNRFTGAHGGVIRPAVMLSDTRGPSSRRTEEAMVGLRNCLAVSTVLRQTTLAFLHPNGHRILYSDPFSFYPWSMDRDYNRMISITPALTALHRVRDFSGQPSPSSPVHRLYRADTDRELLTVLTTRWGHAYRRPSMGAADRALFRSLNMATAAMSMPATTGVTLFDYGRLCALWISAFEILAHFDSGRDRANLSLVLDLLEKKPFLNRGVGARRFQVVHKGKRRRVSLPLKIYEQLYRVRNDFLHGNTVTWRTLKLPRSGRFIGHFAPLLYRCALRNFLNLRFVGEVGERDLRAMIEARFAEGRFERAQYETEESISLAIIRADPENY